MTDQSIQSYPFTFGMKTLRAPYDDIQGEILKEVSTTQKSTLIMIYGYHWPQLTVLIKQLKQEGKCVQMVMDRSQTFGDGGSPGAGARDYQSNN